MAQIRTATAILAEIRGGAAVVELSEHIHKAIAAVKEHGKPAKVVLELTIAPMSKGAEKLVEAPLLISAESTSKLPRQEPEPSVFFADEDGNPVRNPTARQPGLALGVASTKAGG